MCQMMSVSMNLSNACSACLSTLWMLSHSLHGNPCFTLLSPDWTLLWALPGCVPTQQYLLPSSIKTWFFLPLDKDWCWLNAHRYIEWHMLWPLFIMASDSFLGRRMNVGEETPGRIWRKLTNAHFVSATQISPSRTQRQLTLSISGLFWMPSDSSLPPSHTTTFS